MALEHDVLLSGLRLAGVVDPRHHGHGLEAADLVLTSEGPIPELRGVLQWWKKGDGSKLCIPMYTPRYYNITIRHLHGPQTILSYGRRVAIIKASSHIT